MNGKLSEQTLNLHDELAETSVFDEIVGPSAAMRHVIGQVIKVASSEATVLITSESGTGKELIARAIQRRSNRSRRPLICYELRRYPTVPDRRGTVRA